MIKLTALSLAAFAMMAAPAPTIAAGPEAPPAEAVLAALPTSLFGAPAMRTPNSTLVSYFPTDIGRSPIAGVLAIETTTISSTEEMRARAREAFHDSGLNAVLREASFTSPAYPGGRGFFGEYKTSIGLKQSWTLETGRYRIHTTVTVFNPADRDQAFKVIADEIYHGAQLSPEPKGG